MGSARDREPVAAFGATRRWRRRRRLLIFPLLACLVFLIYAAFGQTQEGTQKVRTLESDAPTEQGEPPGNPSPEIDDRPQRAAQARKPPIPQPAKSCDDLRVLVDRTHALPPHYAPQDLVSLQAIGVSTLGGDMLLRREAAHHLRRLMAAATADGVELVVASAYRSYADQQASHARWASYYGAPDAGGMSADPGHSQHQLGTAVDFTNAEANYEIWQGFGKTRASDWLAENAPRYGFVLAYPLGKEEETGYQWEPWHYRYIGLENVRRLEESGLSLQAFLTQEGVLPRC